jgi:hypothetical protein
MVYQLLKEVEGQYRLSFEVEGDDIELLKETWQGGDFDFAGSIGLTDVEFITIKSALDVSESKIKMTLTTGTREVRLDTTGCVVDLSCYWLDKKEPEFSGDFTVDSSSWDEIAPTIAEALAGGAD